MVPAGLALYPAPDTVPSPPKSSPTIVTNNMSTRSTLKATSVPQPSAAALDTAPNPSEPSPSTAASMKPMELTKSKATNVPQSVPDAALSQSPLPSTVVIPKMSTRSSSNAASVPPSLAPAPATTPCLPEPNDNVVPKRTNANRKRKVDDYEEHTDDDDDESKEWEVEQIVGFKKGKVCRKIYYLICFNDPLEKTGRRTHGMCAG